MRLSETPEQFNILKSFMLNFPIYPFSKKISQSLWKTHQSLIYCFSAWQNVSGSLKQVSVGPYGVWGVDQIDEIFRRKSNTWQHQTGDLKDISVGKSSVWGVARSGQVFRRTKGSTTWQLINGTLLSQV